MEQKQPKDFTLFTKVRPVFFFYSAQTAHCLEQEMMDLNSLAWHSRHGRLMTCEEINKGFMISLPPSSHHLSPSVVFQPHTPTTPLCFCLLSSPVPSLFPPQSCPQDKLHPVQLSPRAALREADRERLWHRQGGAVWMQSRLHATWLQRHQVWGRAQCPGPVERHCALVCW